MSQTPLPLSPDELDAFNTSADKAKSVINRSLQIVNNPDLCTTQDHERLIAILKRWENDIVSRGVKDEERLFTRENTPVLGGRNGGVGGGNELVGSGINSQSERKRKNEKGAEGAVREKDQLLWWDRSLGPGPEWRPKIPIWAIPSSSTILLLYRQEDPSKPLAANGQPRSLELTERFLHTECLTLSYLLHLVSTGKFIDVNSTIIYSFTTSPIKKPDLPSQYTNVIYINTLRRSGFLEHQLVKKGGDKQKEMKDNEFWDGMSDLVRWAQSGDLKGQGRKFGFEMTEERKRRLREVGDWIGGSREFEREVERVDVVEERGVVVLDDDDDDGLDDLFGDGS